MVLEYREILPYKWKIFSKRSKMDPKSFEMPYINIQLSLTHGARYVLQPLKCSIEIVSSVLQVVKFLPNKTKYVSQI